MSQQINRTPSPRRPEAGQRPVQRANGAPARPVRPQNGQASAVRRPVNGANPARPQNSRPAARPAQARPAAAKPAAPQKSSADTGKKIARFLKKAGYAFCKALRFAGIFLVFIAGAVFTGLKKGNRKLDIFRKNETTAVITNCAVAAIAVSFLICIFLLLKPSMDASRAEKLAAKGNAVEAVRIVEKLQRKGYKEEKLTATKLTVADRLIDNRKFDEAREILSSMEKTEKTNALSDKYDFRYAQNLYEKGEYSQAAQMFYQMPEYQDSLEYYYNCRCALAINAFLDGQEHQVQSLLLEIPNVADRIQKVIGDMTGDQDEEMSALIREAFNEEKLKDFEQMVTLLTAAKENIQKGRIAAGYCHTLGLKADGTVYAAGDNMYGQANVSGWSNVTQVAAGAYHSVALFKDGTVDAVGDNSENQLDVYGWTDIVAIAASGYDTIGLKADGTVVACGMHADLVSGWHGVTMVTGGAHSMGCLYDKGYMMSTHAGAQMDMSVVLFDLAVCGNVSAGILYDGSLITNIENAPEWSNIVSIEASSTGIFAIDANGKILSYFYRPGDSVSFDLPGEAVEIASGGTHHVVLTGDGRVYSFGDNEFGQLNTVNWNLQEGQA